MIVPMLHVPDVRATVEWYLSIGFRLTDSVALDEADGAWASLTYGMSSIMITSGGSPASGPRRDVDLYVYVNAPDSIYGSLRGGLDVVEPPHDTFYGMREFCIRDINGYWLIFGASLEGSQTSTPCD